MGLAQVISIHSTYKPQIAQSHKLTRYRLLPYSGMEVGPQPLALRAVPKLQAPEPGRDNPEPGGRARKRQTWRNSETLTLIAEY
jgi:hypothetical protein